MGDELRPAKSAGGLEEGERSDFIRRDRWVELPTLWWNVLALTAVLTAVMFTTDNGSIAIFDEAVYATQATALSEGSWVAPRGATDIDPFGVAEPLMDATPVEGGSIAYSRHPLYPVLIVPWIALGGYSAALLLSVVGVVGSAVCAAFIARRLDVRYGVPALWFAGLMSPLVADALVLWAHSLVAASAGLLFLAVLRVLDGCRTLVHTVVAIVATGFTVMIRSEGVLFVGAVGLVVAIEGVRRANVAERWRALVIGGSVVVVGAVSYLADGWWSRSVGGGGGYGTNVATLVGSERVGAVGAAWSSLFRPGRGVLYEATEIVALATIALVVGVLAIRVNLPWKSVPWCLAMIAAVGWVVAIVANRDYFWVSGLFPAFPALVAAVVLLDRSTFRNRDAALSVAVFVVGGLGLVFTIYPEGGATEWGGRFFHVLLVPVFGLMLGAFDACLTRFNRSERRLLAVPVAALLLVPSAMAVRFVSTGKSIAAEHAAAVESAAAHARTTMYPPLVVVFLATRDGSARTLWALRGRVDVLVPREPDGLYRVLDTSGAQRRGVILLDTDLDAASIDELVEGKRGVRWRPDDKSLRRVAGRTLVVLRMDEEKPAESGP